MNKTIYELTEGLKILQKYDPDALIMTTISNQIRIKIKPDSIIHKNDLETLAKYRWGKYENIYTIQL